MAERTTDGRVRGPIAEARAAELAEHYARILGRQADHRVSAVVRTCLRRLPARLPIRGGERRAVEALIERVLRLGDVGSPDLLGSTSQIHADIARRLGEPAGDPRGVYRALRAMLGRTAIVVRHSRQLWELRLAGLADAASEVHRALVAETPALYCLPTPDAVRVEPAAAEQAGSPSPISQATPPSSDPLAELLTELARTRDELTVERQARAEVDQRREVAEAELDLQRRAQDEERRRREEAERRAQEADLALAEARRELDGIRQAQAADADKLRELVEAKQFPEAATYLAARMLGLNLGEAAQALLALVQSAAAEDASVAPDASTSDDVPVPAATTAAIPVVAELPPPASAGSTEPPSPPRRSPARERPLTSQAPVFAAGGVDRDQPRPGPHLSPGKVGRNSPCPCGSGKKFKRCCGPLAR
jgi:hypothetical protein